MTKQKREDIYNRNQERINHSKIIFNFPVYYSGWECDYEGWIMEDTDGKKFIKLTNHGEPYVASTQELESFIKDYLGAITAMEKAIKLLD